MSRRTASIVMLTFLLAAQTSCSDDPPVQMVLVHIYNEESFGHCPPITARSLAKADIAFSGTVTDVRGADGSDWIVTVDHWYTGGHEKRVDIEGSNVSIGYWGSTVGGAGKGGRYLVTAVNTPKREFSTSPVGLADACRTRPWSKALATTFDEAFPKNQPRKFNATTTLARFKGRE